jgi:hypothetical protein
MAGTVRIFFVNLLPALAFELDMLRQTGGFFGINEALLSSALAAFVFSTMSCQPLTVVGITGLISLFNYTIYDIAVAQGIVDIYPQFIAWVAIWAAITHWMAAIFNWCDYMRYITDFSTNSFGMYVSIIYMSKLNDVGEVTRTETDFKQSKESRNSLPTLMSPTQQQVTSELSLLFVSGSRSSSSNIWGRPGCSVRRSARCCLIMHIR